MYCIKPVFALLTKLYYFLEVKKESLLLKKLNKVKT